MERPIDEAGYELDDDEKRDKEVDKEVEKALSNLSAKYRTLFGNDPGSLSIAEIQNKIATEMRQKGLRPYKL